jgi:hypothetical protein
MCLALVTHCCPTAVAECLNVIPKETLRVWECRDGFPLPQRDAKRLIDRCACSGQVFVDGPLQALYERSRVVVVSPDSLSVSVVAVRVNEPSVPPHCSVRSQWSYCYYCLRSSRRRSVCEQYWLS